MNSKVSGAIANRLANAVLQFFAFEFSKVKKNQEYLMISFLLKVNILVEHLYKIVKVNDKTQYP